MKSWEHLDTDQPGTRGNPKMVQRHLATVRCPACGKYVMDIVELDPNVTTVQRNSVVLSVTRVHPVWALGISAPPKVPRSVAEDFEQAMKIRTVSPRAAAALFRSALEKLLGDVGYEGSLDERINKAAVEDLSPRVVRELHAVRQVGNYGLHPIGLNVEEGELELLESVLTDLFEEVYVGPSRNEEVLASIEGKLRAVGRDPTDWEKRLEAMRKKRTAK